MTSSARATLRPIRPEDREVLVRIYGSTRTEELAILPWTEEQKQVFIRQQFDAQSAYWGEHYRNAEFSIIEVDGAPVGRLYVLRGPKEIRLVDVALLPEFRRRGIGTRLLEDLFDEATERQVPLTIHVEMFNPARALYERLGFEAEAEHGVYLLMAWQPKAAVGVS